MKAVITIPNHLAEQFENDFNKDMDIRFPFPNKAQGEFHTVFTFTVEDEDDENELHTFVNVFKTINQ